MIEVDAKALLSLYTGGPKVIILQPTEMKEEILLPELSVEWVEATTPSADEAFFIGSDRSAATKISVPPSHILAVWNPYDSVSTKALEQWWARTSGSDHLPTFVTGGSELLVEKVTNKALKENVRITLLNQKLLEELAAIRQGLAHHVRVPPELESLVKNLRKAAPQLLFETPSSQSLSYSVESPLTQPLFVGARGLLGFDLGIQTPGSGEGHLVVVLRVSASGLELAKWKIPYSNITSGWLALRLEKVLARMDSFVELVLTKQGGGLPPELRTTSSGLMPEFAFRSGDKQNVEKQMLEIRIWGGYPGLTYDPPGATVVSHANMRIADHLISKAQTTRPLTWAYPYFGYQDGGKLLLRPLRSNPASAAKIDLPTFSGLAGISCSARIDDALCETKLLVRAALSQPGQNVDDVESGVAALAITEWVELSQPLESFALRLGLPQPISEPTELHLFSRLPQGGKLDHGKVVFGDFQATLDERAAFNHLPYLPVEDIAKL